MSKNEPKFRAGQLVWVIINLKLRSAKVLGHFIDDEDGSYDFTVELNGGACEACEIYREADLYDSPLGCLTAFTKSHEEDISHLESRISRLKDEINAVTASNFNPKCQCKK